MQILGCTHINRGKEVKGTLMDDNAAEVVCHFAHPLEYLLTSVEGVPEEGPSQFPTFYFQVLF